jgi:hypothetical protein
VDIVLTTLSWREHRLSTRSPATTAVLDTRTYLLLDLVHYAVEHVAGIDDGFRGRLAIGVP